MSRYRVELEELLAFVDRLQAFEQRAETVAADVDKQIADLHGSWFGNAAEAHQSHHDEWMAAAAQMREALGDLREAASKAHRNYTEVIEINTAMWP
jgi:WXG100 family type VII secretion target